ncbi:Transcriptional regulator GlxA family, contains an amidase domain and an AraC-type DNA-binding HTH domain [Micromonospora citrea]|uniref:Transcriptional regulator GlxA family, contains an amidase domain and an AraC-type DNA-binding HTH domain n=1 Tax=Micromonospora citrea TaxID=47855 RepID=A0A1C6VX63_9ACTN|nr:Transcriptional regulator GlxA family, contains an amidase domain and an AraC-type DNA-binding HTH domain [Micromonospora citrea]
MGTVGSTRRVLVVGYPAAELLDIACVMASLQMANHLRGRAIYGLRLASPGGAPIRTATGLVVHAEMALERARGPLDTLVVSGGIGYVDAMRDERLVAHVRRLGREARRVASVCTGAGVLAAAGLLDGRRAATHWHHAAYLQARFPRVVFDSDPIFIAEDDVCTSAGVTAALDLTLAFIEADEGPALARDVSRHLVTYLQRPGDQAQMSMFTAPPAAGHSLVHDTVSHISSHLDADLSVAALARLAGVSERHLARLFRRETGVAPGSFVRRARVEAAAHLLTRTDLTVEAVAGRCGFGTVEALRQAFLGAYGVSPSHYRVARSELR